MFLKEIENIAQAIKFISSKTLTFSTLHLTPLSLALIPLGTCVQAEDFSLDNNSSIQNAGFTIDGNDIFTVSINGNLTVSNNTNVGVIQTSGGSNTINILGTVGSVDVRPRERNGQDAIKNIGSYNVTNIYGSVVTTGFDDSTGMNGIVNYGDYNTTVVYGSISSVSENGNAIWHGDGGGSTSDYNTVLVIGEVTTVGKQGNGVFSNGNHNTIQIDGSINTLGEGASGVLSKGNSNIIDVSGSIVTSGQYSSTQSLSASAITVEGDYNDVRISGLLKVSDANSYAIANLSGVSNTYTLLEGARIVGDIYLDNAGGVSGNSLIFDVGPSMSYAFDTVGDWVLQDLDGRPVIEGSAISAGIGNAEIADELMFNRSFALDSSIRQINGQVERGSAVAVLDTYGLERSRENRGDIAAYQLNERGLTIGIPLEVAGRFVVPVLNYHSAEVDISSGTHDIESSSLRLGFAFPKFYVADDYDLGFYAIAGRNSYQGNRDILVNQNTETGLATINAGWSSSELELGADASVQHTFSERLALDTRFGFGAQIEHIGSYAERSYFAWDTRTIVQTHAKANVTIRYEVFDDTQFYGTAGIWRRDILSGEATNYTINDTGVSYTGGIYDETISSLRLGFEHALSDGAFLNGDLTAQGSNFSSSAFGLRLGVSAQF